MRPAFRPFDEDNALNLANLSRQEIRELISEASRVGRRRGQYLEDRGFEPRDINVPNKDKPIQRYESGLPPPSYGRRPRLQPQYNRDLQREQDPRFNKPVSLMDQKPEPNPLAPTGRQSFGPLPRRAVSMPDLSSIGQEEPQSNLEAFRQRFLQLKPKHRTYYENFQREIQWNENPDAYDRMVKKPTIGAIRNQDRSRVGDIRDQTRSDLKPVVTRQAAMEQKKQRRKRIAQDSVLPPATGKIADWLAKLYFQPIPEENEDEEEEEDKE